MNFPSPIRTFILGLSIFSCLNLYSQSVRPDSTFGENGIAKINLGNGQDIAWVTAIQPDRKIVIGGYSNDGQGSDFILIRYLENGDPDPDFGEFGIVRTDFLTNDNLYSLLILPDGRIIAAGQSYETSSGAISMARYLSDGSPDLSFGTDGKFLFDVPGDYEQLSSIALQPDGKIVGAGRIQLKSAPDYLVIRMNTNGTLDSTFANNGIGTFSILDEDVAQSVKVLKDGHILVGGYSGISAVGSFTMIQLDQTGSLDPDFGTAGKVITHLGGSNIGYTLVIQPDDKILLAGNANVSFFDGRSDIGVVRYYPDGTPDETFGTNGISVATTGGWNNVVTAALQPDGKILVGGNSDWMSIEKRWMLARLLPDGILDTGFGDQGVVSLDLEGTQEILTSIALQKDSRIVATGYDGISTNTSFVTARFIADLVINTVSTDIKCFGSDDGAIVVQASSGNPPYQYSLDGITFQSSPLFVNLGPGSYLVSVLDDSGILGTVGPVIIQDAPPPPAVIVEVGENSITVTIDGPSDNFSFELDGEIFQDNGIFTNLTPEFHTLVVKDEKGCILYIGDLLVFATATHEISSPISYRVAPNPAKDIIYILSDKTDIQEVPIVISDVEGKKCFAGKIHFNSGKSAAIDVAGFMPGIYIVSILGGQKYGMQRIVIK